MSDSKDKKRSFIVDKESFHRDFIDSITKFKTGGEFLPIHCIGGKLVAFCSHSVKIKGENKGSVALYIEYEPDSITLEDGEVFYVKDPMRLHKTLNIVKGEKIVFTVTNSHVRGETENNKFSFRLYDPLIASKDRTYWNPKKFPKIRERITDGVLLSKTAVTEIQSSVNTINDDDVAVLKYDADVDKNYLFIGDCDKDSIRFEIPKFDGFSTYSKFSKFLFKVVDKNEVNFGETEDKRLMTIKEESDKFTKYCFVTKFLD